MVDISLFVVGFAVYPIAVSLFRVANLPHRFIPVALVFGSISFTMAASKSPEIQNIIPTKFFGTTPTVDGFIGVLAALIIMVLGGLWLGRMVNKASQNGEDFSLPSESSADLEEVTNKKFPNIIISVLPLFVVLVSLNILSQFMDQTAALLIALTAGILLTCIIMYKFLPGFWEPMANGIQNSLVALAKTCAVVGFRSVAAEGSAFQAC